VKSELIVASTYVFGVVVLVTDTLKGPHNCVAAEPETESNQSEVGDEAVASTVVVKVGC